MSRRILSTSLGLAFSATIIACATGLVEQIPATDAGSDASSNDASSTLVCEGGCPTGQVCSQGQCKLNCGTGENKCGSICTDVKTDPKNCGQCGNACGIGFACKAAQCVLDCGAKTACGATDDAGADAGLVCVDTQTDTLNCGACGKSCAALTQPPNATLGCVAGSCAITKCATGFDDCNKQANDGCEADLNFDKNNCGKCGTVCSGGTPVCGSGKCIATTCGNNVIDSGEKCDGTLNVPQGNQVTCRPGGTKNECKFDFSGVTQLYCNGTCSWGGAQGCDQADADIFCKLKTGSTTSTATAFTTGVATAQPGFCCPGGGYGQNLGTMPEYGVNLNVWYQGTSLQANHGSGTVITSVTCSP
jgi:hypothetical protein